MCIRDRKRVEEGVASQQPTLPSNPEQQEKKATHFSFAKLPPMIGGDDESDSNYPTFDDSSDDDSDDNVFENNETTQQCLPLKRNGII